MRKLLIIGTDIFNSQWVRDRWEHHKIAQKELNKVYTNIADALWEKEMPTKKPLPSERNGKTFEAKIGNNTIFLKTGEYEDGSLGEVFIEMYKEGAGYKGILAGFSICVSWLLQYGVPLDKIVDKFTFTRFEPAGIVTGDKEIKMCTSILDYVFRRIAITYLDRQEFNQAKESELPEFIEEAGEIPQELWDEADNLKLPVGSPTGNKPDVQIYTFGSGSVGYRPVGYKSEEFLKYCRKNAVQKTTIGGEYTLEFNDDSVVVFGDAEMRDKTVDAIKRLFYAFYGNPLNMGDL